VIIKADFHIHTCLSPCASLEMSPKAIVSRALEQGLTVIAITDHNSALNCATVAKLCQGPTLTCLYGIEVCTAEEVHVLCIFDTLGQVIALNTYVYDHLPNLKNDPERFGDQVQVNEKDEVITVIDKYLGSATNIPINTLQEYVLRHGGLFIPSHISRPYYSMVSQLGFLPADEKFSAVEIEKAVYFRKLPLPKTHGYPVLSNSDAHHLESIGTIYNKLEVKQINIPGLIAGFKQGIKIVF
jgi:3',5'-nucleoside bisphosphate phosphatase